MGTFKLIRWAILIHSSVALDLIFVLLAKNTIISHLRKIQRGQLIIHSLGEVWNFGEASSETSLRASIQVLNEGFWLRLFLNSEFGFAGQW